MVETVQLETAAWIPFLVSAIGHGKLLPVAMLLLAAIGLAGMTFIVARKGGSAPNVVCETASVKIDVRFTRQDDVDDALAKIAHIGSSGHVVNEQLGLPSSAELAELAAMPPMPAAVTRQLYELARAAGTSLGQDIDGVAVGYASDGNTLAATGMALLVGLGSYRGGMHTADEFMLAKSFGERVALSKAIILKVARKGGWRRM